MIPVKEQPEPDNFDERVRVAGMEFLAQEPHPSSQQWKGKEYWRRVLPDLRKSYGGVCAYCANWIPYGTGSQSVDHFVPKSEQPSLAYEWTNFRYVSARFNSRKGTRPILDPFQLEMNWFVIDFNTHYVHPNPSLLLEQQDLVNDTIRVLKLNEDDDLVEERYEWSMNYRCGEIPFDHLKRYYPFIAYEISRQGINS